MRYIMALTILASGILVQGQRTSTPGRVGGSVNLPTAQSQAQKNPDTAVLSPEEKQQYEDARKNIPKLTVQDFFVLRAAVGSTQKSTAAAALSENFTKTEGNSDVSRFAALVAASDNSPEKALQKLGLSQADARKIYDQAKHEGKTELKSRRK